MIKKLIYKVRLYFDAAPLGSLQQNWVQRYYFTRVYVGSLYFIRQKFMIF